MPYTIEIGLDPLKLPHAVAPGSPFVLDFKNSDKADWSGDSLACDVRDEADTLMFRVTSADGEIVVDSEDTTRITMTWSIAKTALLADYTPYKFDVIVTNTKQIVWPVTQATTVERVTE
jgi:hypothetical protein